MSNSLQRIPPHDDPPDEHADDCQCSFCLGGYVNPCEHIPQSFSEWLAQTNQHIASPESMEQNYDEHHENSHD